MPGCNKDLPLLHHTGIDIMMHVFVDTNFFLHYQSYDSVKWFDLFHEDIFIIISRTVLKELDNHKNSENKRRSRRARGAVSLVRELMSSPKEIQKNGFCIKIGLMERFDFSVKKKEFLDLSKADDCIANEVLVWAENNSNKRYYVVTGDVGLRITCHDCDLPCHELPQAWRLPPEPDERDKKIKELKASIQALSDLSPNLDIKNDKDIYDVEVKLYEDLSPREVIGFSEQIFNAFPEKQNFTMDTVISQADRLNEHPAANMILRGSYFSTGTWHLPTQKEIHSYHKNYAQWKEKIISTLDSLHKTIKNETTRFKVKFSLENNGTAPAEDVNIKIFTSGNMLILPEDEERTVIPFGTLPINWPLPPSQPKKEFLDNSPQEVRPSLFGANYIPPYFPSLPLEKKIDTFYWEPEKPKIPVSEWELSCREFRHKIAKENFDLDILIPESGLDNELYIEISVYSRQLASPLVKTIPVKPIKVKGDFYQRVSKSVERYIRKNKKSE
jgi:rRNA-processing protein FCF1